jgi:hypothetical protein
MIALHEAIPPIYICISPLLSLNVSIYLVHGDTGPRLTISLLSQARPRKGKRAHS